MISDLASLIAEGLLTERRPELVEGAKRGISPLLGLDCQIQALRAGFGTCPEPVEGIRRERELARRHIIRYDVTFDQHRTVT